MYSEKRSRTIDLAMIISAFFHIGLFIVISQIDPDRDYRPDLHEIAFMDITYRPEVARITGRAAPEGPRSTVPEALSDAPVYAPTTAPDVDLSTTLERNQSQARIDLNGYELDRDGNQMDIIRLGGEGSGKTTEEILAQPRVDLSRGMDRSGVGGRAGLRGTPGVRPPEAQLQIEHRPLADAPATRLPEATPGELSQVEPARSGGSGFDIAGPISQRRITNRTHPSYPRWARERRITGAVAVRIWVDPEGKVKGVPTVETSSGYPDLDQVVVNALRAWEFEPLGPDVKAEDQWGVITFRFVLT